MSPPETQSPPRKFRPQPAEKRKPIVVKVGPVAVKVYPLTDGRYAIIFRRAKGARRETEFRRAEKEARERAGEICIEIANGSISADQLNADERLQAVTARDLLAPLGISLDTAARELVQARELSGGAGFAEMARFWARHHADGTARPPAMREIHAQLLRSLADQDLAPRWRQALKEDLKRFVDGFHDRDIREITAEEIQTWLRELGVGWRTRNNYLALVRQLFHSARSKGYLVKNAKTEPDEVERLKRPRGAHQRIGVLSAGELGDILAAVGPAWLPSVVLGSFAGLRRAEVERLDWSDIRWDEKLIHIRQEVAKSTRRVVGDERFVPMRPQLLAWLEGYQHHKGPVCIRTRWEDELARLRKPVIADDPDRPEDKRPAWHGKWPKNAFRHTYGSCRTSETKNMPLVADEMGNSVAEIRRDYRNPRTDREVAAWAALYPRGYQVANVISMAAGL